MHTTLKFFRNEWFLLIQYSGFTDFGLVFLVFFSVCQLGKSKITVNDESREVTHKKSVFLVVGPLRM